MTLEEFLTKIQPACDHSVRMAMYVTGLSEVTCRKYLEQAVQAGLYRKEWIQGNGQKKETPKSQKFIGRFEYIRIKKGS